MTAAQEEASPRRRLVEAAVGLLADGGIEAVQTRRLAAEAGTSTMAVYTHFGGMPQLIGAVVEEGFRRFADQLAAAPTSDDSVADLLVQGAAYRQFAVDNPQLYRLMFGLTSYGTKSPADVTEPDAWDDALAAGAEAYAHLVRAIERVIQSERLSVDQEAQVVSAQVWTIAHGHVLLDLAGFLGTPRHSVTVVLVPLMRALLTDLGESPERFAASLAKVEHLWPG